MSTASRDDIAARQEFARALSDAIVASGRSLESISGELADAGVAVSPAALSYWQNGHSMPVRRRSLQAVVYLEKVLELPTGALSGLTGKVAQSNWALQSTPAPREVAAVLHDWGLSLSPRRTQHVVQAQWTISADRRRVVERSRSINQTDVDAYGAFPVVLHDPTSLATPRIEARHGCRLGRQQAFDEARIVAAEILLAEPLARGSYHWTELEFDFGEAAQDRNWCLTSLVALVGTLSLDVCFEGAPPAAVHYGFRGPDGQAWQESPVRLCGDRAQVVLANAAPGHHRLEWQW